MQWGAKQCGVAKSLFPFAVLRWGPPASSSTFFKRWKRRRVDPRAAWENFQGGYNWGHSQSFCLCSKGCPWSAFSFTLNKKVEEEKGTSRSHYSNIITSSQLLPVEGQLWKACSGATNRSGSPEEPRYPTYPK